MQVTLVFPCKFQPFGKKIRFKPVQNLGLGQGCDYFNAEHGNFLEVCL
jgi:hypothetical protein